MATYKRLIGEMPADFQEQFPVFDEFLSPAHYTRSFAHDWIDLSITGERRFKIVMGPHAKVIMMAWAAQRMEPMP